MSVGSQYGRSSTHSNIHSAAVDALERLWVAQLYKEHHDLASYHKVPLRPVVIKVDEMSSAWGTWDPFFRVISISKKLITGHSWDVVLEILKHEMAHQYVSECMGLSADMSHGDPFKTACLKLGVSSWAARATGKIPDVIPTIRERVLSRDDERLLDRVEKLLSLAQSTNEHEALLAMERVRELYAKHNLERLRQSASTEAMDSLFVTRKKKKTDPTDSKILSILNAHFRVRVIHTQLFDAAECVRFKAAEILGRRENILMAEFVYHFLTQQCASLWAEHKRTTKCRGTLRRSYQLGVLSGFDEKLKKAQKMDESVSSSLGMSATEVNALLKIETSELGDFVSRRYPRLSTKSWGRGNLDLGTFSTGQTAGRSLNLNKPMGGSSGGFGGFLT
jgi:Protein of unknown function (DUF2786)/SprT-like family